MTTRTLLLTLIIMITGLSTAFTGAEVKSENITLYQPDEVIAARKIDVSELSDYVQTLTKTIEKELSKVTTPESLDLVIIVKPGKLSKAWFVSSLKAPPKRQKLLSKLAAVPSINTIDGPFAFAITFSVAGGKPKNTDPNQYNPPIPNEWREAIDQSGEEYIRIPEGIVDSVWQTQK